MTTNYEELKLDIESNNRQTNISNNQETITQENLLKKKMNIIMMLLDIIHLHYL